METNEMTWETKIEITRLGRVIAERVREGLREERREQGQKGEIDVESDSR